MRILSLALAILMTYSVSAQRTTVFGKWKTIDDKTEKIKSIVEIYEKDGKAYGKITNLFRAPEEDQDPLCDKCKEDDERYNTKVIGMVILRDMVKDGDRWEDGNILDPDDGKIYDCKMWVEDGNLRLRGYILFFYRTQTWLPVE